MPGAAPRTSTPAVAPLPVSTTVHPVGRSVYVKWPTLIPGTAVSVVLPATRVWAAGRPANATHTQEDGDQC